MTDRAALIADFLTRAGHAGATRRALAGDASFRRYERVTDGGRDLVLMDAAPPQEDVRPFLKIGAILTGLGLSAPQVRAADVERGLLLLEDLGDDTYNRVLARDPGRETMLYELGVDALIALHRGFVAADHRDIPVLDLARARLETARFLDWWWPAAFGADTPAAVRASFAAAWDAVWPALGGVPATLALFDYHIDNLLWLPDRAGAAACGLLDFQDAVLAPQPFDLVSLIEDVRRDVDEALGRHLVARYLAAFPDLDPNAFHAAYAACGAERNIRILGTFVRLWRRDGKPGYLKWLDRTWRLVERDLAHPALGALRNWFDDHISGDMRFHPLPGAPA